MMAGLNFCLFGSLQITRQDESNSSLLFRPAVQALLAYLLLHRHRCHRREVLTGLFWGDHGEEGAKRCLSTTLWRLRRELEDATPTTTYLDTTTTGEIHFTLDCNDWFDVALFEERVKQGLLPPLADMGENQVKQLEEANQLYIGDLLEGHYADWALLERERLRTLHLKSLARLMHYYQLHGAYEQALAYGQHILNLDPLREDVQRHMMQLYRENGQRALAVRQYQQCKQLLASEMNIPPMPETQTLYAQIIAAEKIQQPAIIMHRQPATLPLPQVVQQLNQALQSLEDLRTQLQQTLQKVASLIEQK